MDEGLTAELAAVAAIYGECADVPSGGAGGNVVRVRPCRRAPQVEVGLQILDGYPSVAPEVSVEGLAPDIAVQLVERLKSCAAEHIGDPMIHMLAQEANSFVVESCVVASGEIAADGSEPVASTSGDGRGEDAGGQEPSEQGKLADSDTEMGRQQKEKPSRAKRRGNGEHPGASKKNPMREAKDVIHRIQWDPNLDVRDFVVGYLDRFLGIVEKPFAQFTWRDLAIPQHRIQYFKCRGEVVWSKVENFDHMFGSRGDGTTIDQVLGRSVASTDQCIDGDEPNTQAGQQEGDEVGGQEDGESDTEDAVRLVHGRCTRQNAQRPNYFVCFRVTDPGIVAAVCDVQESMVASIPILAKGCLPVAALHVTLCTLRLRNEDEVVRAREVLHAVRPQIISLLPQSLGLTFTGVGTLGDRLLFVDVQDDGAVSDLSKLLMEEFEAAGVSLVGNHDDLKPHMTFMRLTRPMFKELGTDFIDGGLHDHLRTMCFGIQHVDAVHLCSMMEPLQANGFYFRLATVGNNLLGASPRLHDIVQRMLRELSSEGLISEDDAKLVNCELSSSANTPDSALEAIRSINSKRTCHRLALIMRGEPGSGKSALLSRLNDWHRLHICSADRYFEQHGEYKFNAKELVCAREYCFERFLDGIENGRKFLAVDNANAQLWEYAIYRRVAELCGYHVEVVELSCPNSGVLKQFASRNAHGVSYPRIQAMYERWEVDPTARMVRPWLEDEHEEYDPSEQLISVFSEILAGESREGEIKPEVVYTAVFLTAKSVAALLRAINPAYANVHSDHVTLAYRPEEAHLRDLPFGQCVHLRVTGVADDGHVQGVAVEFTSEHGIKCTSAVPHVTISRGPGASAATLNGILTQQGGPSIRPCPQIELEGVVGCVMDVRNNCRQRIVDKGEFTRVSNSIWQGRDSQEPVFGSAAALHIFDFDGTLFDTPGPIEGKKEYKVATGRPWPHTGWYGRSETLMPPLKVYPGPALHQLRTHCGRSGSITVVLTGRLERSREALEKILEAHGVCVDRVILKDVGTSDSTEDFKVQVVTSILADCPKVKRVKIWEDLPENLAAFHKAARRFPNISWKIIDSLSLRYPAFEPLATPANPSLMYQVPGVRVGVSEYLSAVGAFPQREQQDAARTGLRFIAKVWASSIQYQGNAMKLAVPFGSYMLGRAGDVDLCLLAPEKLSVKDCLNQLRYQLERRGVKRTYIGASKWCPRLRVCLDFATSSPVEFDIVFCRVDNDMLTSGLEPAHGDKLPGAVVRGDAASKAAAAGPALHSQIMRAIPDERALKQFAVAVEVFARVLKARKLKGSAFHAPRTFHLVKMLARHVTDTHASFDSSDEFSAKAIELAASISQQNWAKVFGDTVPISYLASLTVGFSVARCIVQGGEYPKWGAVHELLSSGEDFPPEGYCVVAVHCRSRDSASLWRLSNFIEVRAGSYIRMLLDSGIMVVPGTTTRSKGEYLLEFGVPERSIMAAQHQCQPLVDEARCHEARSNAWMEVRVPKNKNARLHRHSSFGASETKRCFSPY